MQMYVARPGGAGPHPGVVVLHQLFGVDGSVRRCVDRLAAAGFVAVAPDLYHRAEDGVELPQDAQGRRRGFALMEGLTRDGVVEDVRECLELLRAEGVAGEKAGLLGVSLGGHAAFVAAARLGVAATVVLYPGWLTGTEIPLSRPEPTLTLAPEISGELLFLVGDRDHVVPAEDIVQVRAALGDRHEVIVYPDTPHAFFLDADSAAARDAWERIQKFFAASIASV
ncbi:dienelactone hydrolase family protein [Dactylosporangium vinaceum]|uniref:Dienelactone hydrolase family protein n=1 Tax=Dactylosporangium vinaceum TaxID=53362 RepID=A0ABV5M1Y5_9ACTN|nr:dienelactone hydrolase family protein [Dactylosporangium vinaceum]UAB99328.1 dienelactone hydrolase family protein [Dactylosporangium vinaceum]